MVKLRKVLCCAFSVNNLGHNVLLLRFIGAKQGKGRCFCYISKKNGSTKL